MLQHPVPEPVLARIGDITVSFALLEMTIQSLVHALLRDDQRIGQIVTAELSFPQLRALAMSLYRERHGEVAELAALSDLMALAADLEGKRNRITHSVWGAGEEKDTVTRIKTTAKEKRGIRSEFVNVSSNDLGAVADDLKQLAHDVQRFVIALVKAGEAS